MYLKKNPLSGLMIMRLRRQSSKPEGSAAATATRTASEASTNFSIQAESQKVDAISNSKSAADNSPALNQLKKSKPGSTLQAAMRQYPIADSGNDVLSQELQAGAMGAGLVSAGQMKKELTTPSASHTKDSMLNAPAQGGGGEAIAQLTLIPLEAFKGQFKDDKETQANLGVEYHAQICEALENYHQHEYDLDKGFEQWRYDYRKERLLDINTRCQIFISTAGKRGAEGSKGAPLEAVTILQKDAKNEYDNYYKNEDEGKSALRAVLSAKSQQKEVDMYSVDEFKGDADLTVLGSNFGDMAAVVGKLKAYHAIQEIPNDDGTRKAKLIAHDALMQLATETEKITQKSKQKSEREKFPPASWYSARLDALVRLIAMLKNNRGRYEDSHLWRINLQDLESRNRTAAAGTGVSMKDVSMEDDDSDWVDVDDGYVPAKELKAETDEKAEMDEIVKRLSGSEGK